TALAAIASGAGDDVLAVRRAAAALRQPGITTSDRAICKYILATQHLRAGRATDAARYLEENVQLRLSPQDWFLLGLCRQRQQDLAGAIAALQRVVEIDPSEPRTYRLLADWHAIRGEEATAAAVRQRATLLEENTAAAGPAR